MVAIRLGTPSTGDQASSVDARVTETMDGTARVAVTVEVVRDVAGFHNLKPVWNDTLQRSAANVVFLTWEWLSTWLNHFGTGRALVVVVVRNGGEIAGIAPLIKERREGFIRLGTIGVATLDYEDWILTDAAEKSKTVTAILNAVEKEGGWDYFQFNRIPEDTGTLPLITRGLDQQKWRWRSKPSEQSPYVPVEGNWDQYWASLSSRLRKNIARSERKLVEEHPPVMFREATIASDIRSFMTDLFAFHRERRLAEGGIEGPFASEQMRDFYASLVARLSSAGWARLPYLHAGGRTVALQMNVEYAGSYLKMFPAFDATFEAYGVGRMLNVRILHDAFDRGLRSVDFLRGVEPYKFDFNPKVRQLHTVTAYPPGARGLIASQWVGRLRPAIRGSGRLRSLARRLRR
jgi:CelD/BcsL family acetyltransferase involved in cellulose biosynthesis